MQAQFAQTADLRRMLIDEIFNAMGLPSSSWLRRILWPLAWPPAQRFARIAASADRCVAEHGFREAANRMLYRFVQRVAVWGAEYIPTQGPLLVASNHPGSVDSLAIAASLPRDDLKIVVSGAPFFHGLTCASQHLLYAPENVNGRMLVLRNAVRHLGNGGAVLIFPTGLVDPDPAVFPFASQSVEAWSSSVAWMLDKVPATRLLITVVSGVLARECWRNPLVRLRESMWEKQKLAEFIQIIQQLVFGRRFPLIPQVAFGQPLTLPELSVEEKWGDVMGAILDRARRLMDQSFPSSAGGAAGP